MTKAIMKLEKHPILLFINFQSVYKIAMMKNKSILFTSWFYPNSDQLSFRFHYAVERNTDIDFPIRLRPHLKVVCQIDCGFKVRHI